MPDLLETLATRRSVTAKDLTGPGPDKNDLSEILTIGSRVPDHGKLVPWRFIIFEGDARTSFGEALAGILRRRNSKLNDAQQKAEIERFTRAPLVISVIYSEQENEKIPKWEQKLCVGAVCYNVLLAAIAKGYAGQWLTEWCAFDDDVDKLLGLKQRERVAGFLYIGTPEKKLDERDRPDVAKITTYWKSES